MDRRTLLVKRAGRLLGALIVLATVSLGAQGPFPAQIQAAIRALLAGNNTWTGTNTFNDVVVTGTCTGCGGGALAAPVYIESSGTTSNYTYLNSGIVMRNAADAELFRLWSTGEGDNGQSLYFGYHAGEDASTPAAFGGGTLGIGYEALANNTDGFFNTAVGWRAMVTNTGGTESAAFGYSALRDQTIGFQNVALGPYAGLRITEGGSNTFAGYGSGNLTTTGNSNTAVGWLARPTVATLDNTFALGAGARPDTSNTGVLGDANVTDVYFGGVGAAATSHAAYFLPATGYKSVDGTVGATVTTCTGFKNGLCISGT